MPDRSALRLALAPFLLLCGFAALTPDRAGAQQHTGGHLRERRATRQAPDTARDARRQGRPARGARAGGSGQRGRDAAVPTPSQANVAYGADTLERFDVYLPAASTPVPPGGRPVIVYVHGGGWRRGDKSMPQMVSNKAPYFTGAGAVFVSVNYRVLPTNVLEQARDVARAVAAVQRRAGEWQVNPGRTSLMGHSAGAHLVALVTADPSLLADAGARPVVGTVALDQASLDVPASMTRKHFKLYDDAFGTDTAFWTRVSPIHQMQRARRLAAPMLVGCSTQRLDPCPQGRAFAAAAIALKGRVEVLPLDLEHQQINDRLGLPSPYTDKVTAFLRSVGALP